MSIKQQKTLSVTYIVVGVVMWILFAMSSGSDYQSGLLCGLGSGLTVVGAARLVKLHRLTASAEKAADYEAARKDERIRFLSDKARAVTFVIGIYLQLAVGLVAQFVFGERLLCTVLCGMVSVLCLVYVALYYCYAKKY